MIKYQSMNEHFTSPIPVKKTSFPAGPGPQKMANLDPILAGMTNEQLELLRDYDSIADDFLSSNFNYRDGSMESEINNIKAQNLNLARFCFYSFLANFQSFETFLIFLGPIFKPQNKYRSKKRRLKVFETQ